MIPLLTLLVAILCACVGFLLAKVESQRDEIDGLSGDIRDLWAAVSPATATGTPGGVEGMFRLGSGLAGIGLRAGGW